MMKVRTVAMAAAVVVAAAAASSALPKVSAELSWSDRPECTGLGDETECPSGAWCNDGRCVCDGETHIECASFDDPPQLQCVHRELLNDGYCDCEEQCTDEERDGDERPPDGDGDGPCLDCGGGDWGTDPGDGSSAGDPHFRSLDGLYFDYQGLGEFTYCQNEGLTIHTCQQPWVHNPTGATVNHAVSVDAAGSTVTIQHAAAGYNLYVDGALTTERGTLSVGTATVEASAAGILVTTAAGDRVALTANAWAQWIDISYRPAAGSSTTGLCGTNNGNVQDDLTRRDGSVVPLDNFPWFYINQAAASFGESWRATSSLLPASLSCPTTASGFQSFDILADGVFGGPEPSAAAGEAPRNAQELAARFAQKKAGRRVSAASLEPVLYEHYPSAVQCLATGLGITVDELNGRLFAGNSRSVRYWQAIYDLLFFTYGNDSGNAELDNATCAGGHRILEALIPDELVAAPDTDVVTAFCDATGNSCSTASAASANRRVALKWSEEADAEC